MAGINVGAAIGAGFGLIRKRPLSVLVWGAIPALVQILVLALLAPVFMSSFVETLRTAASGGAVADSSLQGMPGQMLMVQGGIQLLNLVQLLLGAMISCAVWRAVLKPQNAAFAYLRIGGPELFFIALSIGLGMAVAFAMMFTMIPAAIVGGIVGAVTQSVAAGIITGAVIFLVAFVTLGILVGLRFVFIGPMMVADGQFHFGESWTATRGHVGSLFMIALGIVGIFLLIELVFLAVFGGIGAAIVMSSGGFEAFGAQIRADPVAALTKFWPLLAIYMLAAIPVAGCARAIAGAPWARALQDVMPGAGGTADAFA